MKPCVFLPRVFESISDVFLIRGGGLGLGGGGLGQGIGVICEGYRKKSPQLLILKYIICSYANEKSEIFSESQTKRFSYKSVFLEFILEFGHLD